MPKPTLTSIVNGLLKLLPEHIPNCPPLSHDNVLQVLQQHLSGGKFSPAPHDPCDWGLGMEDSAQRANVPAAETIDGHVDPAIVVMQATKNAPSTLPNAPKKQKTPPKDPRELIHSLPFAPTDDQVEAWCKICDWIGRENDPFFVLRGYAGVGKSTLLQLLTLVPHIDLVLTAPTNKATRALSRTTNFKASTTYSALKLRLVEDYESDNSDPVIERTGAPLNIPYGAVFVVDETGCVNVDLLEEIRHAQSANALKVLLVGDPAQLPPVGERLSATWKAASSPESQAFLSTVCRYDNHILSLCTELREKIRTKHYSFIPTAGQGVSLIKSKDFIATALHDTTPDMFTDRKIIAWRNKQVNEYNEAARLYFGFSNVYEPGDVLMFASPLMIDGTQVATIDDEVHVKEVGEDSVTVTLPDGRRESFDVHTLRVEGDLSIHLRVAQSRSHFDEILSRWVSQIRKAKPATRPELWRAFFAFKGSIARMRYAYAITAHRAQGSTLKDVFVDTPDILRNPEISTAFRCLYVAMSRASQHLYLMN